jgi:hypothetical protein
MRAAVAAGALVTQLPVPLRGVECAHPALATVRTNAARQHIALPSRGS